MEVSAETLRRVRVRLADSKLLVLLSATGVPRIYVSRLQQVRAKTLAELGGRKDQWLEDRTSSSGGEVNNDFKWFHVFGHEINHRGQIRWSRTRATSRPS